MEIKFVLNQLRGLAAVDNKLKFIRSAAEKYELPEEAAARILAECDLIETRMNDDRLKMAVVGEFSSGKSSFINALLREELLETDVLQGTTVLSVMIYYSDAREITVIENGIRGRTVYENADEFRGRVRQLNRDTGEGSKTMHVEIGLPSEFLKRGICIIDTPGTNSVNVWHDEAARRAIHERADGCLVLTSAVAPLPMSLCGFVEENLSDILPSCIFIATKIDLTENGERRRLMDFIVQKAEADFELSDPLVLPYSSLDVLNGGDDAELSRATEDKILEALSENKFAIQQRGVLSLMRQIMEVLLENMQSLSEETERRHSALEQAATVDLDEFVSGEIAAKRAEYDKRFADISRSYCVKLDELCDTAEHGLDNELNSLQKGEEIVSFFKKLPEKLKAVGDTVLAGLGSENGSAPTAFGDVEKMCAKLISKFESYLTTQYPTLTLLADKGENKPKVQFKVAESWNTDLTANESLKNYVTADDEKDERASLAGCGGCAAAGAVIGSIIPGLGTVLGGGLGFVVGAIAMSKRSESPKRAKKLREKTAGDYAAIKARFFEELKSDLTNAMRKHSNVCRSAIADTAHEYLDFYKDTVRELTERNKAERLAAEQCIKELDEDVRRLRTFSEETENILKHLGKENGQ